MDHGSAVSLATCEHSRLAAGRRRSSSHATGLAQHDPRGRLLLSGAGPVPTRNRFAALSERCVLDSDGAQISQEKIVDLKLLIKPTKQSMKRRVRRPLSSSSSSGATSSVEIYSAPCHNDVSSTPGSSSIPCTSLVPSSCCPSSCCLQTARRPCYSGQGYQHPGHGQRLKPRSGLHNIEPHSGISQFCINTHIIHKH